MDISTDKLTLNQVNAACALLEIDLETLASNLGVRPSNIVSAFHEYEQDPFSEEPELVQQAVAYLKKKRVHFLGNTGVNLDRFEKDLMIFKGENALEQFWSDMARSIPENGVRYVYGIEEERFDNIAGEQLYGFLEQLRQKKVTTKILVDPGDYNFIDPTAEYRWARNVTEGEMPHFLYGDKYALLMWHPEPRFVVINNKELADSYRKVFQKIWDQSEIPNVLKG